MCTIYLGTFAFASGWVAVTGLLLDIFGFVLLAADVVRTYQASRAALTREKRIIEAVSTYADAMSVDLMWHNERDEKARTELDKQLDPIWDEVLVQPHLDSYRLARIWIGVVLILVGFSLQIVGSWPCA